MASAPMHFQHSNQQMMPPPAVPLQSANYYLNTMTQQHSSYTLTFGDISNVYNSNSQRSNSASMRRYNSSMVTHYEEANNFENMVNRTLFLLTNIKFTHKIHRLLFLRIFVCLLKSKVFTGVVETNYIKGAGSVGWFI
jgi:hypothetical protein